MSTEADVCREWVLPRLQEGGWDQEPHSIAEQRSFAPGRYVLSGAGGSKPKVSQKDAKRADYILRYTRDFPIAVVEAKARYKSADAGLQQAKDYAEILGLPFAYATNGRELIEFDFLTGAERLLDTFPSPAALWARLCDARGLDGAAAKPLLTPCYALSGPRPRYYQDIAINRTVEAITQGQERLLLVMATGTGKTPVAFQICWKLWSAEWNREGKRRKPKILYLADRNFLVDRPAEQHFAPFDKARVKITGGHTSKSRDIYFSIYQALAQDERRPGLYKSYPPDFFDLVIVDECHRGSAREDSAWREILEYFAPAFQLGMTATPVRADEKDTVNYFGSPLYVYSLKQGIEDGFLAPYRVHRVTTNVDAVGWRPGAGDKDRFGRDIPDELYGTKDFERAVALLKRTKVMARHLSDFLKSTDRFAKTIVFCADQDHAAEMRRALNNCNTDLARQYPDYVCRVTSDEGGVGRAHLSKFQDVESKTLVILTTSQLLTTGLDAPSCQNIVLARVVGSMIEFKQIIGRGTRVYEPSGKTYFNILDYTGSATQLFADPAFDGDPTVLIQVEVDENGDEVAAEITATEETPEAETGEELETGEMGAAVMLGDEEDALPRKFYYDGGSVEISAHLVYDLDPEGKVLRVVKFTEYSGETVRTLFPSILELREHWANAKGRSEVIEQLEERGIAFSELAATVGRPDADPFDLLCHLAFDAPLLTRRERAERLRRDDRDFFDQFGSEARRILTALLEKYAQHGLTEFTLPDALRVPPLSDLGTVAEITKFFGGGDNLRAAVDELQSRLYAN